MLKRLESYIRQVLTWFDTEYPELIYAVDVVNEAFNGPISDENPHGVVEETDGHENYWFEVVGTDYVYYAFYYARQYAPEYLQIFLGRLLADAQVKLGNLHLVAGTAEGAHGRQQRHVHHALQPDMGLHADPVDQPLVLNLLKSVDDPLCLRNRVVYGSSGQRRLESRRACASV